jgi:hypothetical protein
MSQIHWIYRVLSLTLASLVLVACQPAQPMRSFDVIAPLYNETFDEQGVWNDIETVGALLRVVDGAYRGIMSIEDRFIWGVDEDEDKHTNVIVEVEATVNSNYGRGMYGVMCRAGVNSSRGYHFLLSMDGAFSIRRSDGRLLNPIVPWQDNPAIPTETGRHRLRAVCIDDYLALYVNGTFIADVRDELLTEGYAGVMLGVAGQGEADVAFDNLTVYEAR